MPDSNYDKTVLLLPMSGVNNGVVFDDYSKIKKSVTVYGNAKTATDQYKYYGSSAKFDGAGDYLTLVDHADFRFGSTPFSIEFYLRLAALPAAGQYWGCVGKGSGSPTTHSFMIYFNQSGALVVNFSDGASLYYPSIGTLVANRWYHVSVCAIPSEGKVYRSLDGVVQLTTYSPFAIPTETNLVEIGRNTAVHYLNGHLQDLRITKGVARYTANFTPPGKLVGVLSGSVKNDVDANAIRAVCAFPRLTRMPFVETVSASDGTWSLTVPDTEHTVICLDDAAGTTYNDLIHRATPV